MFLNSSNCGLKSDPFPKMAPSLPFEDGASRKEGKEREQTFPFFITSMDLLSVCTRSAWIKINFLHSSLLRGCVLDS